MDTATHTKTPTIVVTDQDYDRLQRIIDGHDTANAERLDAELARAQVVSRGDVPEDVVTMNSDVVYEDTSSGNQRRVRVVYPQDADVERGWVSVLAPLGSALLGLRVGQVIDWRMPSGIRRLRIAAVPYQPEASGDSSL